MKFLKQMSSTVLASVILLPAVMATRPAQAQTFTVLHTFTNTPDGASLPEEALALDAAGKIYGVTSNGGTNAAGVFFTLDPSGTETVVHSFVNAVNPQGMIRDTTGNIFGTSTFGAPNGYGAVFQVDPTGKETDLYIFTGGPAGAAPSGGLVRDAAGNLYGNAIYAGDPTCGYGSGCGVIFKVDPNGNETILHAFHLGSDGAFPYGSMVLDAAGNLYGTTHLGGDPTCNCGTVYRIDPSGQFTIAYTFTGPDGASPYSGLVQDDAGNLYGATFGGGTSLEGTVFKLNPTTGTETVLYSFTDGADGGVPWSGVVLDAAGNIYGTTSEGGLIPCPGGLWGCGVVFKVDPATGTETVLYTFKNGADGAGPGTNLVLDTLGNLYGAAGTANTQGCANLPYSCGIVFKIAQVDYSLSASALTPGTVKAGGSSTSTLNVAAAAGGFSGAVALTCSVTPTPALAPKCSFSSGSITPGTASTLTVSTTPRSASAMSSSAVSGLLYAVCLPLIGVVATRVVPGPGRKRKRKILTEAALACVLFASLVFQVACGGGSSTVSTGGHGGTPSGTYTISITGVDASGTLVHSTNTMIEVQ